jgi:hypothetical protein
MGLLLSTEHGMNPTIPVCYACGKDKNEVVLTGAHGHKIAKALGREDGRMPMRCCLDKHPCDDCIAMIEKGLVICIECKDGSEQKPGAEPARTGKIYYVPAHRFKSVPGKICFIEESLMHKLVGQSGRVLERCEFEKDAGKDWEVEGEAAPEAKPED